MGAIETMSPAARERAPSGDERRLALTRAAYRLIAARGFEGLRVRDVAADVGVNIATLHYYFPTKEGLIRAVVDHLVGRIVATTTGGTGTAGERLRANLARVRAYMRDDPDLFVVLSELLLRARRDAAIHAALKPSQDDWRAYLRGLLAEGVARGEFRPDLDADGAALAIMAIFKGMTLQLDERALALSAIDAQLDRWLAD